MSATHYTSSNFDQEVLKSDKTAVIDFYAEWCGPCQMAAPIIDKLSEEYKDRLIIGKVNVDEARDIAQRYGVMSIPTMIIFKNGEEIDRKVGFPGEAGLRGLVESLL